MTYEELMVAIETLRAEGYDDESMLKVFYLMYSDGKIDTDTLRTLTEVLGYEFTEDFENMSEEDKHTKGLVPVEDDEVDEDDDEENNEGCHLNYLTTEEALKVIEGLKKEYGDEETVVKAFYVMYQRDLISLDDLRAYIGLMGYEFTEEFEAMSEKDKKIYGLEPVDN